MNMCKDINTQMESFRLASRELFNNYFLPICRTNDVVSWDLTEGYSRIRSLLFRALVTTQVETALEEYGDVQKKLRVVLREGIDQAPALINRDISSGYWDHPIDKIDRTVDLRYEQFFDWDQFEQMDNRYVMAVIDSWPTYPEAKSKRVLIDWMYVKFDLEK